MEPSGHRAAAPIGLGLVLLCLLGTLMVGSAHKEFCAAGNWADGRQYRWGCYTDVVPLFGTEQLAGDRLPFLDECAPVEGVNCDEYPVLTMYFMRGAAWLWGDDAEHFFHANEFLLGLCAAATAVCLYLLVGGRRTLYFALAPTLLLGAFVNWDLFAVALATGGLLAFLNRRDGWAGVLLGLGAATKLYPVLFLVPFVAHRIREREPDRAIGLAWATLGTWAIANVPFAIASPSSWWNFFRFNALRVPDWDSLWYIACRDAPAACFSTRVVNAFAALLFVSSVALVWWLKRRREATFARWTLVFPIVVLFLLTSKVYSPQYGLWLLPLFAVALPNPWAFAAFSLTDVAMFFTRFRFFGTVADQPWGWPQRWFEIAVVARAIVLVWCVVLWIRRPSERLPGEARAGGSEDDDAATLDGADAPAAAGLPEPAPESRGPPAVAVVRTPSEWFTSWRPSIAVLMIVASITLTGGYVLKARCLGVAWDGRQWTTNCQNDIQLVYSLRGIADDRSFPPRNLEYPAGTVLYVGAAAWVSHSARGFFQANAVGIMAAGIALAGLLALLAPTRRRVVLYALGPPLFLSAFQNWDLLALALLVAGLFAATRGRHGLAGLAVGLGAAVKLFPLLALPALVLLIHRNEDERARRPAVVRSLSTFAAAFAGTNLLLYAISPASWRVFWSFQADRFPNPETWWFMLARHVEGMFPSQSWSDGFVWLANAGSTLLFAVACLLAIALFFRNRERPPIALAFLLLVAFLCTAKVFSPQYMMWLLPFFALLPFPWYTYVAYVVADIAVLVSVNGYFTTIAAGGDWPHSLAILEVCMWLRYAVLIWLAIVALGFRTDEATSNGAPATAAARSRSESRLLHSEPGSG